MDSKVVILADETTKAVVNVSSNNPEYGYVKVQQIRTVIDDNGFLRRKSLTALIPGTLQVLQDSKFYAGQQLDGKIVIEESLEPFNTKTPERDLKIAGETGIVCRLDNMPIYRRTKLSLASNATDDLIKHDNVEELRNAYNTPKTSALKPNEEFEV